MITRLRWIGGHYPLDDAGEQNVDTAFGGSENNANILEINPAFENIFEITQIDSTNANDLKGFPARNIQSIAVPNLGFTLVRGELTRKYHVKEDSFAYHKEVPITWIEDDYFSVIRFHEEWQNQYYDTTTNRWKVGKPGKFINLKVAITGSSPNIMAAAADYEAPKRPTLIITLTNVSLPNTLPSIDLDYSKADPITYSLLYPVEKISAEMKNITGEA